MGPSEQAEDNQKDEQKINPKKSLYEHLLQVKKKHNIAQNDKNHRENVRANQNGVLSMYAAPIGRKRSITV